MYRDKRRVYGRHFWQVQRATYAPRADMENLDDYVDVRLWILRRIETRPSIRLVSGELSRKGALQLAEALAESCTEATPLEELVLKYVTIDAAGMAAIAKAIGTNTTLKTLVLHGKQFDTAAVVAIGQAMETNTTLERLVLKKTKMAETGTSAIAKVLETNSTLKELELSRNTSGPAGCRAIAKALATNTSLRSLRIRDRNFDPAALLEMAKSIETNSTLKTLDVFFHHLEFVRSNARVFEAALEKNTTITDGIWVFGNDRIRQALRANEQLEMDKKRLYANLMHHWTCAQRRGNPRELLYNFPVELIDVIASSPTRNMYGRCIGLRVAAKRIAMLARSFARSVRRAPQRARWFLARCARMWRR